MKVDLYTKGILTVIAACLAVIVFRGADVAPKAYAADTGNFGMVPLNEDGSINVKIVKIDAMEMMDVNIRDISTYDQLKVNLADVSTSDEVNVNIKGVDTYDELPVNIDEIGGSSVSGGALPVKDN